MNRFKLSGLLFFSIMGVNACKTSGDIAGKSRYVDPTEVKTLDNPSVSALPASSESLARENEILRGELENFHHSSTNEKAELLARIKELENKNLILAEEIVKIRSGNTSSPIEVQGSLPRDKTGAPLLWELAQKDISGGRHEKAISPLSELVKTYPKDPKVLPSMLLLGTIHYKLGNFNDSVLAFNQAIDKFPKKSDLAFAWFGQGSAFWQMKRADDSKLFFEELVRRYPKSNEAKLAIKINTKKEKVPSDLFPLGSSRFSK